MSNDLMSPFAKAITEQKYSHTLPDGRKETWAEISKRVTQNVMSAVPADSYLRTQILTAMSDRKFIAGGRYNYAAGRPYHQTQNCVCLRADDSREGWGELTYKSMMSLMTGAGVGVVYSDLRAQGELIKKTGGVSSGPISLMNIVNEQGRRVRQGGDRRSALFAGLHWNHPDIFAFITSKNWSKEVKDQKAKDYNFPADLDGTNISVILDDDFFTAYHNKENPQHKLADEVFWTTVKQMLTTAEPGFSVDIGENNGENLRNAPVFADTPVLTDKGYKYVGNLVGKPTTVWTGEQWASDVVFVKTKENTPVVNVSITGGRYVRCDPDHEFILQNYKRIKAKLLRPGMKLLSSFPNPNFKNVPTVSPIFSFGEKVFTDNCFYVESDFKTQEDTAYYCFGVMSGYAKAIKNKLLNKNNLPDHAEWELLKVRRMLESIGIYSDYVNNQLVIKPQSIKTVDEVILKLNIPLYRYFFSKDSKDADLEVIKVEADGREDVYCADVKVPEHSFCADGVIISNCTEITSRDDSDICNLGSINMSRVESLEEMKGLVDMGTSFLLAGTVYSDIPYPKIGEVRSKNRRLGLGLLGLHEWLLKRGKKYGPDSELQKYLEIYATSGIYANKWADTWGLSHPLKTRAVAPGGSIGIVAETTTGIEPIFCVAYKRRYLKGETLSYQYVVDPTAQRLINSGMKPEDIEDAYVLAENVERRVLFQSWIQEFVDHGISSTINLPEWGSPLNNEGKVKEFGDMLMRYLPKLRGVTVYPNGARGGQPLTPVKYQTAIKHVGEVFTEQADICDLTKTGGCG